MSNADYYNSITCTTCIGDTHIKRIVLTRLTMPRLSRTGHRLCLNNTYII